MKKINMTNKQPTKTKIISKNYNAGGDQEPQTKSKPEASIIEPSGSNKKISGF